MVSLRTMGFPQWKKIDRIREELTWNILNSFRNVTEIKGLSDTIKVVLGDQRRIQLDFDTGIPV